MKKRCVVGWQRERKGIKQLAQILCVFLLVFVNVRNMYMLRNRAKTSERLVNWNVNATGSPQLDQSMKDEPPAEEKFRLSCMSFPIFPSNRCELDENSFLVFSFLDPIFSHALTTYDV